MFRWRTFAFAAMILCSACGVREDLSAQGVLDKYGLSWADVGAVLSETVAESEQVVSHSYSHELREFVDQTLKGRDVLFAEEIYGLGRQEWLVKECLEGLFNRNSRCEDKVAEYYDRAFQKTIVSDEEFARAISQLALNATISGDEYVAKSVYARFREKRLQRRETRTVLEALRAPRAAAGVSLADVFDKPGELSLLGPYVSDATLQLQKLTSSNGAGMSVSRKIGSRVGRRAAIRTVGTAFRKITGFFWIADILQTPQKRAELMDEVRDTMLITGGQMQSQLLSVNFEQLETRVAQVRRKEAQASLLRLLSPIFDVPELRRLLKIDQSKPKPRGKTIGEERQRQQASGLLLSPVRYPEDFAPAISASLAGGYEQEVGEPIEEDGLRAGDSAPSVPPRER